MEARSSPACSSSSAAKSAARRRTSSTCFLLLGRPPVGAVGASPYRALHHQAWRMSLRSYEEGVRRGALYGAIRTHRSPRPRWSDRRGGLGRVLGAVDRNCPEVVPEPGTTGTRIGCFRPTSSPGRTSRSRGRAGAALRPAARTAARTGRAGSRGRGRPVRPDGPDHAESAER